MKVVSFVSHKGGVGKTTNAYNVALALPYVAQPPEGRDFPRVLFIDLDETCDGTRLFLPDYDGSEEMCSELGIKSLNDFFTAPAERNALLSCIFEIADSGIFILPGSFRALLDTDDNAGKYEILRQRLSLIAEDFEFCVIDCPPARGYMQTIAMLASDVVVPCSDISHGGLTGVKNAFFDFNALKTRYPSMSGCVSDILVRSFPNTSSGANEALSVYTKDRGVEWYETKLHEVFESVSIMYLRYDAPFISYLRENGLPVYANPKKGLTLQYAGFVVELVEVYFGVPLRVPPFAPFANFYPQELLQK